MELTEDKIALLKLAESSSLLDEKEKLFLQQGIDSLDPEQVKKLTAAFMQAKERLDKIENDFQGKALPLKLEYVKLLKNLNKWAESHAAMGKG